MEMEQSLIPEQGQGIEYGPQKDGLHCFFPWTRKKLYAYMGIARLHEAATTQIHIARKPDIPA